VERRWASNRLSSPTKASSGSLEPAAPRAAGKHARANEFRSQSIRSSLRRKLRQHRPINTMLGSRSYCRTLPRWRAALRAAPARCAPPCCVALSSARARSRPPRAGGGVACACPGRPHRRTWHCVGCSPWLCLWPAAAVGRPRASPWRGRWRSPARAISRRARRGVSRGSPRGRIARLGRGRFAGTLGLAHPLDCSLLRHGVLSTDLKRQRGRPPDRSNARGPAPCGRRSHSAISNGTKQRDSGGRGCRGVTFSRIGIDHFVLPDLLIRRGRFRMLARSIIKAAADTAHLVHTGLTAQRRGAR
jgi:hypothetical protein